MALGNVAGLLAFATETALVFLLTLYLQEVLGYSPLAAGLSFAVLGAGTVLGGLARAARDRARRRPPRARRRSRSSRPPRRSRSSRSAPTQAGSAPLLVATFAGGVANLVAIVGFMVTATSGLPDDEQGLATGLTSMSQQVGIALGIPVLSAIATAPSHLLDGLKLAIGVDAAGRASRSRYSSWRGRSPASAASTIRSAKSCVRGPVRCSQRWASGDQISSTATSTSASAASSPASSALRRSPALLALVQRAVRTARRRARELRIGDDLDAQRARAAV